MSTGPGRPVAAARDERFLAFCGLCARAAGVFVFLVGGLTLLGWFFHIRWLLWTSPDRIVMKANAALAFVLSGISLFLIGRESEGGARKVASACAFLAAGLGAATLIEYAGWNLDIDQLLVREATGAVKTSSPGRMAPNTALNFSLLGTSLVLLCARRGHWPASVMSFLAAAVGLLALLGYAYSDEVDAGPVIYTLIAPQTAASFIVLALGVLLATKEHGLMGPLSRQGVGSVMARRVLPAVLLVPLLLEWLRHEGEHLKLFGDEFGVALALVASMMALALVVLRSAIALNRADEETRQAEATLATRDAELARSTEILETIYSNMQFMVAYMDSRFNFIRVNPAYAAATGHSPGFFPGRNHFDLYPDPENEDIFRRVVETGEPYSVFARAFRHPDQPERGATYWDWSLQPVQRADGTVHGLVFCLRDVTERVVAESRLRDSERRLEMAIEGADLGLWDLNVGSGTAFLNENWARMLGYSLAEIEPTRATWERLIHPDDRAATVARFRDHLEGRTPFFEAEYRMRTKSGEWRWISSRGRVLERGENRRALRASGINRDITKAREMEETVMRQEKMATLGQLAAGIAHEIRNPLSGLNIYLAAAESISEDAESVDDGTREKLRHALGTARAASVRIEGVIRRVMDFVKPSSLRPGLVDVNEIVAESVALAAPTLRKGGVRIATALADGLPRCRADSRLLEQLLLNLVSNANQAMELQPANKAIEIATGRDGSAVFIAVADSGPGVPEELRDKIFDPFFTTRPAGTGLGLSICRRIVSEHGGSLRVGRGRLGGSEFRVVLPAAEEAPAGSRGDREPA